MMVVVYCRHDCGHRPAGRNVVVVVGWGGVGPPQRGSVGGAAGRYGKSAGAWLGCVVFFPPLNARPTSRKCKALSGGPSQDGCCCCVAGCEHALHSMVCVCRRGGGAARDVELKIIPVQPGKVGVWCGMGVRRIADIESPWSVWETPRTPRWFLQLPTCNMLARYAGSCKWHHRSCTPPRHRARARPRRLPM